MINTQAKAGFVIVKLLLLNSINLRYLFFTTNPRPRSLRIYKEDRF